MGFFSGGNKNESHGDNCRDRSGAWWAKPNPMGWGDDKPRKLDGKQLKMHGSRAERRLAGGKGALIKQNGSRVKVTGEKPRGKR